MPNISVYGPLTHEKNKAFHRFCCILYEISCVIKTYWGQSWCRVQRVTDCKHDRLWLRSPLHEMIYLFKLIFSFLRRKTRRWVPTHNTQCLQNSENGKQSVLTLNFLRLPRCVRDTAWSWCFFLSKISGKWKFIDIL